MQGVRILTVFLYLSDVEEGGGTNFPELNMTVQPKRGRAVIWPSVLDAFPHQPDLRTNHQALPVIKGLKYGANAWLHQRDTGNN
jgi:prolyl 4-hydroxylase